MGWIALTKDGDTYQEGDPNPERGGRPVAKGEEGSLAIIAQEDFGHKVAVDLYNGVIAIDYESLGFQDGQIELVNPRTIIWICDETNIVGDLFDIKAEFFDYVDEKGRKYIDTRLNDTIKLRNDIVIPLIWRPIWFTRFTNGLPTKVIGAQTTLPTNYGGKNIKKMVSFLKTASEIDLKKIELDSRWWRIEDNNTPFDIKQATSPNKA